MAQYYNPGKVDVKKMEREILAAGGGKHETKQGDVTHVSVYSTKRDWHLSYDIMPNGSIENVHSTRNGKPTYDYGGGF